jgi:GNAT superfamily N-acetyltransferase
MLEDIVVEPMTGDFILWRCIHGGPLSCDTIDKWSPNDKMPWARYRDRNRDLLSKLTQVYGACAIVARDGDGIAGQLRFYPKAVWEMDGAGLLCLQQDSPAGPVDDLAEMDFPPPEKLQDRTLEVHCLMAGSPSDQRYKRKGIATRMIKVLIQWARENGWEAIQANSFEDLPLLYQVTGNAGHTFWEKLGFRVADRYPHPHFQERTDFVIKLEEQGKAMGIAPEKATDRIVMRLDLT